ncbi:hypothetical protein KJP28_06030 [Maritimibacter sp. DP4N28-5]|uniref:WD40 repeat domain-containing protein n=1 Tax=Maritimibacter dapengensis TaxID=2836868 RepID=A0ABS6SZU2_9RHOB|nr:hypothetical protein [Maritimibacter dapengensis]
MFFCTALALAGHAQAQDGPELHVVAVGKGRQTDDFYALPETRIMVDRPGQSVALVLIDGGEMQWRIDMTEGTRVLDVIRSGPDPENSAIMLADIPMTGIDVPGLPLVRNPVGQDFRKLVKTLTERYATDRLHSFQAARLAPAAQIVVDQVQSDPALAHEYLAQALGRKDDLPPGIRDGSGMQPVSSATVTFDTKGVRLTDATGTRDFPVTPDVPRVLLPVASTHDPATGTIYAMTYGGEGYIYTIDTKDGAWRVVTSLEEYDARTLLFDPTTRALVTTGAFSRPGEIKVFAPDGETTSLFVPTTAFPGLTDLFDYGNEHGPPLVPRRLEDGWLLLDAEAPHDDRSNTAPARRSYALDIDTGDVRLLSYRNP